MCNFSHSKAYLEESSASKEPSGEAMNRRISALAISLIALILASPNARTHSTSASPDAEVVAFVGAKIYTSPTDPPISNGTVIIRGEKIEAVGKAGTLTIPTSAKQIDCKGAVITAAFQNSHVHFIEPKWTDATKQPSEKLSRQLFDMFSRYGFTTVVDLGSFLENTVAIRKRIESGEIAGPKILTAGGGLFPPNGAPFYVRESLPPEVLKMFLQPATPEEAVQVVKAEITGGADVIKLFTGSLVEPDQVKLMPEPIAVAAVSEAHAHDRLVFSHPSNMEGAQVAIDARVDVLAHTTSVRGIWSEQMIAQMRTQHMSLVPTLKLWKYEAAKTGASPEDQLQFQTRAAKNLTAYANAGGQILFGTDVGYMTDYDPTEEYAAMSRAGLTPMQILASLTTAPAERFGESNKRGRIAKGMDADLVILESDPLEDATNFAKVRTTYRAGRPIVQFLPKMQVFASISDVKLRSVLSVVTAK
jgi:imidazolonepropionase-like amidohydrolase